MDRLRGMFESREYSELRVQHRAVLNTNSVIWLKKTLDKEPKATGPATNLAVTFDKEEHLSHIKYFLLVKPGMHK